MVGRVERSRNIYLCMVAEWCKLERSSIQGEWGRLDEKDIEPLWGMDGRYAVCETLFCRYSVIGYGMDVN